MTRPAAWKGHPTSPNHADRHRHHAKQPKPARKPVTWNASGAGPVRATSPRLIRRQSAILARPSAKGTRRAAKATARIAREYRRLGIARV